MADQQDDAQSKSKFKGKKDAGKDYSQVFAEDMTEEWAKDAKQIARDAFAMTITTGDAHSTIADYIRKKFDAAHVAGWNCIVGRSFGAYVTHEIKTYIYYSVQPGTYILLWRS